IRSFTRNKSKDAARRLGHIGCAHDRTARVSMSNEREEAALSKALIEMSGDALFALSSDGEVLSWNDGAGAVFGRTGDEAIGKRFDSLLGGAVGPALSALDDVRR